MNATHTPEQKIAPQSPRPSAVPGGEDFNLHDPVRSFAQVVDHAVLHPVRFFARVRRRGNYLAPLVFAVIADVIGTGLGVLAFLIGVPGIPAMYDLNRSASAVQATVDIGSFHRHLNVTEPFGGGVGAALLYGLIAVGGILLFMGMLHLAVRLITGPRNAGLEATVRTVTYASAPQLVTWVPVLGPLLGLYGVYVNVIGLREMHQTTTKRAIWTFIAAIGLTAVVATILALVLATLIIIFA